jgi:predicted  nucleic acid-binding Zn-ribbon protein
VDQALALLALQDADLELMRLRKQLDELPEKRSILEIRAKRRQVETIRSKAELLVQKLQAKLRGHRDELATLTEKIDAEQSKLMSTTDHRQVQALSREIDGLKRRREKVETDSAEIAGRVEKAETQAATIDAELERIDAREKELIAVFQQEGGSIQQRIVKLEADRATYAGGLDADLLARYEDARASKSGIGVGRLESSGCTACRMALPAERVAELESGEDIGVCPACRRLIVVRSERAEQ